MENKIQNSFADEFYDIKRANNVPDNEFINSLKFAMFIAEGKSKDKAYEMVFCKGQNIDKSLLAYKARTLLSRKYVVDILNKLVMSNHLVFADKHYNALNELYEIGFNGKSEKNRVDALKAFIDATKRPDVKVDANVNINVGLEMLEKLEKQLTNMAENAKLLTRDEEIIDVSAV
jgi:hypothetical protein